MIRLALALVLLLATGCAPNQADREFRSRVDSVSLQAGAARDDSSGVTSATAGATVHFRDPALDGLAK